MGIKQFGKDLIASRLNGLPELSRKDSMVEEEQHSTYPRKKDNKISQCPTSVVMLCVLTAESIVIAVVEGLIAYYHTMLFSTCDLSLSNMGLQQVDFVCHGIMIMFPVYQTFLYIDVLRQRNITQLVTLLVFGILMVIYTVIQTIQHISIEEAGCNYLPEQTLTPSNTTNSTLAGNIKLKQMVIIYNSTTGTQFEDHSDTFVSSMQPLEYIVLAVVPVCFLIMCGGFVKLYRLLRPDIYKFHAISDKKTHRGLIAWSFLSGVVKIDLFFLFAYAAQLTPSVSIGYSDIPAFESLLLFGLGLVAFLLILYALSNEDVRALSAFGLTALFFFGYLIYRLFTFGVARSTVNDPYKFPVIARNCRTRRQASIAIKHTGKPK
ncbi:hypothetical protein BD560DRAFT_489846 [Blakeslea trispora]|nr:hypothetical protein BD560DRAFT_489846 [Blakeslea trispora]